MLFFAILLVIGVALTIYLVLQFVYGVAVLSVASYWLGAWGINFFRRGPSEIVSGPLSQEFKQTHGQVAPDMWLDGRRVVFEFGGKSYSLPTLKEAQNRRGDLLAISLGRPDLSRART